MQTVTTNVPGPRFPRHLLGRRLVEIFPYVPIAYNLRISIGIISYLGQLNFRRQRRFRRSARHRRAQPGNPRRLRRAAGARHTGGGPHPDSSRLDSRAVNGGRPLRMGVQPVHRRARVCPT
jgi:WS/DGAT C-terminal domain